MGRDSQSLLLLTLGRSLKELGYVLSAFALEDGEARTLWENIYCYVTVLGYNHSILIDWTRFEGALLSSLETERVISRSGKCTSSYGWISRQIPSEIRTTCLPTLLSLLIVSLSKNACACLHANFQEDLHTYHSSLTYLHS
ncbi:uncharacterized protein LOC110030135 isoform X3 [Phalaenopsis equestris]|nr:uncharacterized protein LOC110030135 isoform X3 [Phalaenopsis equestris]XP_020588373.1 uncharacterized protein LOC110030135 isoform X3 [Phalaenopsis equestris]